MKLIMLRGLPASGKSTIAETIVREGGGNWVRVNKDMLRTMLHFDNFSHNREALTQQAELAIAIEALANNINVVVDDTNLGERHHSLWSGLAADCGASFYTRNVGTDYLECMRRDNGRDKKVGAHVIMNMSMQYQLIPNMKNIVVGDIDGTIADGTHRQHLVNGEKKDWKKYFSLMHLDSARHVIIDEVIKCSLVTGSHVILVSARPEDYRKETIGWLHKYNVPYTHLIMRPSNDSREDSIVKKEIYNKYLKHYNIVKVFDDRPRVVRMWKELGLDVEDVGNGIEF